PSVSVERAPFGMVDRWLATIVPAIEVGSRVAPATNVYLGDVCGLPFANDFFDAVVTDPPYYDNIPYADLTEFFWVWESAALRSTTALSSAAQSRDEYVESKASRREHEDVYRDKMLSAFNEIFRVLKPGRRLCLFLFVRS